MSERRDSGGPAFPQSIFHDECDIGDSFVETKGGMSLRDYFAAQASIGLVLAASIAKGELLGPAEVAPIAYQFADAMLVEREKREGSERVAS